MTKWATLTLCMHQKTCGKPEKIMTISFEEPLRQCQAAADEPQDLRLEPLVFFLPAALTLLWKQVLKRLVVSFPLGNVTKSPQLSAE